MKQLFNKHNSFLIALVFMVVLARIVPYRKECNEIFDLSTFIDWGICIIFLLYGLKLNMATTSSGAARHVCVVSSACFAFLSRSEGYELRIDMDFGVLSGKSAFHYILVGGTGIHCQGQCYRCYLQCLCFGTYRYRCHTVADGFLHRRHAYGRRARRGSAATAAQSTTAAHTRTAAKSFVEKNSGQIHTSDRAFRPTYNIAYRLRELL